MFQPNQPGWDLGSDRDLPADRGARARGGRAELGRVARRRLRACQKDSAQYSASRLTGPRLPAARRWLVRYLTEGTPSMRDAARMTASLAKIEHQ
jgi:hypothetical protein